MLKYAQTLSTERRDFRWVAQKNNFTGLECKWPWLPIPGQSKAELFSKYSLKDNSDLCLQPIIWHSKTLRQSHETDSGDLVYRTDPPKPKDGHWMGYYIEVVFPGDTSQGLKVFKNEFVHTTPGYTWPNTLPFDDCHGESCIPRTV